MARRASIVVAGDWGAACNRVASGEPVWDDPGEAGNRRHVML